MVTSFTGFPVISLEGFRKFLKISVIAGGLRAEIQILDLHVRNAPQCRFFSCKDKGKLSALNYVIKHYTMKAYGGVEL
jgi:hypothetical protein